MTCINYTPYASFTDDELVRVVCTKKDVTDLELELMHRLEYWKNYADELVEEVGRVVAPVVTKYKEAA